MCRGISTAGIPRVWEHARGLAMIRSVGSVAAVAGTGVANKDRLLLHHVAALAMRGTWIDGVLVVETPADGIAFDDLIAHAGGGEAAWGVCRKSSKKSGQEWSRMVKSGQAE